MSNFFSRFLIGDPVERRQKTIVKYLKSKGPQDIVIPLTIEDVQQGFVMDSYGYRNEVVLFLRKDKKARR